MSTGAGIASYGGGAALMNLVQAAASEHGITIGPNTAILLGLTIGFVIHWLSNKATASSNTAGDVAAAMKGIVENALPITKSAPASGTPANGASGALGPQ